MKSEAHMFRCIVSSPLLRNIICSFIKCLSIKQKNDESFGLETKQIIRFAMISKMSHVIIILILNFDEKSVLFTNYSIVCYSYIRSSR